MENFDLSKYINIALKRKWWIIITFLVSILCGLTYVLVTPKIYEAETLIRIQGQTVPVEYVRPVSTTSADDTLNIIYQEVTSRTNSENIINEFGLYSSKPDMLMDAKVKLFVDRISIDVTRGRARSGETSAFAIRFQDEDPRKVMYVTNALANKYMDEYSERRTEEALGTSAFLSDRLKSFEDQLKEKEEERKRYREKYMGGLPEQLQTNFNIIEGLREQLDQINSNLRDAESRKATILRDIALTGEAVIPGADGAQGQAAGGVNDLASLKRQLVDLQSRYTENHPDVIRIKEMIARAEKENARAREETGETLDEESIGAGTVDLTLRRQLQDVKLNIANLKAEIEDTQSQIAKYQKLVDDTPKREQELFEIDRDYEIISEAYNNLRNKEIDAGIVVSMEKVQKGQQFKIIDRAKIPNSPVKPDIKKIMLIALALGLGLGCGIAYLFDFMDNSYKTPDDAGNDLQIPVLASIPLLTTEKELKSKKMKEIFMGVSVALGFFVAASGIVISVKGFDTTLEYVKGVFGG